MSEFENEIKTIGDKLPVSASKISCLTKIALKEVNNSEAIISILANYIQNSVPETRLPLLYVIDSICRASSKLQDKENSYLVKIEVVLPTLMKYLIDCSPKEKDKMKRVVGLWMSSSILSKSVLDKINSEYFGGSPSISKESPKIG